MCSKQSLGDPETALVSNPRVKMTFNLVCTVLFCFSHFLIEPTNFLFLTRFFFGVSFIINTIGSIFCNYSLFCFFF